MMSTITSFGIWNWFIVGGLLLVIELIAPGTFMLWLGLSALLVGVISLVVDWSWQAQFITFAVFCRRLDPDLASRRPPGRSAGRSAVPQPPLRGVRRPDLHARQADRERLRARAHRRYGVARRRPRYAGRHPHQGDALRRRHAVRAALDVVALSIRAGKPITPRRRAADRGSSSRRPAARRRPRTAP